MKNKILMQLDKIKREKRLGIMTHVVAGYPTLAMSKRLVRLMAEKGADLVEIQVPFSDPMADGPTIMRANKAALDQGIRTRDVFAMLKELAAEVEIPLLLMSYFNPVLNYGTAQFCQDAKKAGCAGLIVPDMPLEEEKQEEFLKAARKHNLIAVRLLSPASTPERMKKNARAAQGFVYFVSRKGTTGAKSQLDKDLAGNLARLKKYFKLPVAVGFGIASGAHVRALKHKAEIAVIGSAVLNQCEQARGKNGKIEEKKALGKVGRLLEELMRGR